MTVRQTAWFWLGTNANLFFLSVGVIALEIGLGLVEALIAVVLGTALFATVGLAAIPGVRSGLPTMTVTRAAFGPRGNLPHARSPGRPRSRSRRSTASSACTRCSRS